MPIINGNLVQYDRSDCVLVPGEVVQCSGVYEICHSDEPRATVLMFRNTLFPYCRRCGHEVRYKLLQEAPHISEDPDFVEDLPEADNPSTDFALPNSRLPIQLGIAHGYRFGQEAVQAWGDGADGGNL